MELLANPGASLKKHAEIRLSMESGDVALLRARDRWPKDVTGIVGLAGGESCWADVLAIPQFAEVASEPSLNGDFGSVADAEP